VAEFGSFNKILKYFQAISSVVKLRKQMFNDILYKILSGSNKK